MKRSILTGILFLTCSVGFSGEVIEKSSGTAKDKNGKTVYLEKHTSRLVEGVLQNLETDYFTPNGNQFGDRFGSIRSDFSVSAYVPNYEFEDKRHRRSERVTWSSNEAENNVIAFAKPGKKKKQKTKTFAVHPNTVTGQGLHNYLRTNLSNFKENTRLKEEVKFLIPMNQAEYNFRIRTTSFDREKNIIKLRIEADSWFFRLVAPHIDVTYDTEKKRLLEYKGPSNLLDKDGKKMSVTIGYKYDKNKEAISNNEI